MEEILTKSRKSGGATSIFENNCYCCIVIAIFRVNVMLQKRINATLPNLVILCRLTFKQLSMTTVHYILRATGVSTTSIGNVGTQDEMAPTNTSYVLETTNIKQCFVMFVL